MVLKTISGFYTHELHNLLTPSDMDSAIDRAARLSSSVVAEFTASATDPVLSDRQAIELAIEFFIPPDSLDGFASELDDRLMHQSFGYAAARHRGELAAPIVRVVAPGAFHQWRCADRRMARLKGDARWSEGRDLLEGVLRQSSNGWREIAIA